MVAALVFAYVQPRQSPPTLEELWRVGGLASPESAAYDSSRGVVYVSNINGEPLAKDGDGSIARVSPDGELLEPLLTGLNGPKGIGILGDELFVADIDRLVVIDLNTGEITQTLSVADTGFLNDLLVIPDSGGAMVLMSDTFKDRIYRWATGSDEVTIASEGPPFVAPNGLLERAGSLLVANWGNRTEGFATSSPGAIWRGGIDLAADRYVRMSEPFGNLDGMVSYRRGNYIVTDWLAGKIYHVNDEGEVTELAAPGKGSADLGLNRQRRVIYVPMMLDNQLIAYKIK